MKKVLLITYHFPPDREIGAQRPSKLAKYLGNYGWEPIVLTIKREQNISIKNKIIQTDYLDVLDHYKTRLGFKSDEGIQNQINAGATGNLRSSASSYLIKIFKDIIAFPDEKRGWYKYAMAASTELIKKESIDAIISTSPSTITHFIAHKIKKNHGIPWIADLRDLWTQNHFYNKQFFIRKFEQLMELKILKNADLLVTVTEQFAKSLKELHKRSDVYCLTNGYDEEDFPKIELPLSKKFTITYAGSLYSGRRNPSLLFGAVNDLINSNTLERDMIEIRIYSSEGGLLTDEIKKCGLEGIVHVNGLIPRDEALKKFRESQLLLLLLDSGNREEDVYPAKIFEYFASKRPVIGIGSEKCAVKDLFDKNNGGRFASDMESLKCYIAEYYREFITNGSIRCRSNCNINNYAFRLISQKYAELLTYAADNHRT